ncbi:MAG: STAS domain-containing protein [Bryobacteraceae bacterium]|nr:STAS domain-containing protein [Bryobacteraceae bacterium]
MPSTLNIARRSRSDGLELAVSGRLDGYWADHLAEAVDEVLREGIHRLCLNLAATSYVSSAGVRVLMQAYKQFASVNGSFRVIEPSAAVLQVLSLVGLAAMLLAEGGGGEAAAPREEVRRREADGCLIEIYQAAVERGPVCRTAGRPEKLRASEWREADVSVIEARRATFGLGLGAFGEDWSACRDRFGEFLALAGHAACQPTDGTNYPDYMMTSGTYVPRLTALYGLTCEGPLPGFLRFETTAAGGPAGLDRILSECMEAAGAATVAVVFVAESSGLVGASLRRSPPAAATPGEDPFGYPAVRDWISYSPERLFPRSVTAGAGIASTAPPEALAPFVRPMGGALAGHFHAASFGYRPLPKGRIELEATVTRLFEAGGLRGVTHLIADRRPNGGAGESEFLRGACWFGPIDRIAAPEVKS